MKYNVKKKLLSLGAVAMDIVIESSALPENDGFAMISSEKMMPGGSASNVSVAAASLGLDAFQTGKIGDDEAGDKFRVTLTADGVDDSHLVTMKNGTTLHTYILTAPGGKHCIFANAGNAVSSLAPDELPEDIMDSMDIFYTDMFSSKAALYLAHKAREQGKPVIYNMQCTPSFMALCGTTMSEINEMISLCTLFTSGQDGYSELSGEAGHKAAMRDIYEKFHVADGVICTTGSDGSIWYDGTEYAAPAFPVEAIDTTGAGDCFIAALISSYYDEHMKKADALLFANAAAALKCLQKGPRNRAGRKDVTAFINSSL